MAKVTLSSGLKYLLFFSSGILIFYFVYRGKDPGEIWDGIKEFKLSWVLLSFGFSILSHIVRALRWRMMIQPLGYSPSVLNTFLAILILYLTNFVFPRMGEVSRCGVLTKYEKVPFAPQIGTVVTERIVDFVILVLILLVVVLAQFGFVTDLIENIRLNLGFDSPLIQSGLFWAVLLGSVVLIGIVIYYFRDKIRSHKWTKKIREILKKFLEGMLSIRKLTRPGLFALYSILIYVFYFLMTYAILKGYAATSEIGPMGALLLLAMGSIGMVIPVQGGIGTYHFFAIQTLLVLGISRTDGDLVALVLHGSMTIFLIFIGLVALLVLPLVNRKPVK